jgi:DNA-damage-inducible protein J
MAKTASMYLRIDPEVKRDVESIYAQYGMSVTEAINIFLYQSRNVRGLPFDLRPNTKTIEAIREGNEIIEDNSARFESAETMLTDLKA